MLPHLKPPPRTSLFLCTSWKASISRCLAARLSSTAWYLAGNGLRYLRYQHHSIGPVVHANSRAQSRDCPAQRSALKTLGGKVGRCSRPRAGRPRPASVRTTPTPAHRRTVLWAQHTASRPRLERATAPTAPAPPAPAPHQGCRSMSSMVIRFLASITKMRFSRSLHSGDSCGVGGWGWGWWGWLVGQGQEGAGAGTLGSGEDCSAPCLMDAAQLGLAACRAGAGRPAAWHRLSQGIRGGVVQQATAAGNCFRRAPRNLVACTPQAQQRTLPRV